MKHFWSHFFIPQERNNHRAAILRTNTLLILIAFYLLNQSVVKFVTFLKPGILGYSSEITIQKVLDQTNIERQKNGLNPLKYNSILSESATKKAQDMFTNNYWAHNSPLGKVPWDFFKEVGYKYSIAGENLARDFYDTDSLMKAWMNSPTHRANIINDRYQEIGIGVVNGILGGVKTTLVVQHFATPVDTVVSKTNTTKSVITPTQNNEFVNTKSIIEEVESTIIPESVLLPQTPEVLSQQNKYISPLLLNKIISIALFVLIISVLFFDGFITLKNNTHRLTGSTVGHIGFLLVILLLIISSQQGAIF
ncbi:MAG: CAP domain-containing protein [Candidatus Shapirobacteria bacterium]|nr:CAP domain-containing protein [Candidatus Shapirobacteria bacterium]